jgi:hypothetical protein
MRPAPTRFTGTCGLGREVLAEAIARRRPVRASYHGHERLMCPHVLGWKDGRLRVLSYQVAGTTRTGGLPTANQRWRSMFVDDLENPVLTRDTWETADNYSLATNAIGDVEIAVVCDT